jgi:hypothetical protein
MAADLVERDEFLCALDESLRQVTQGHGRAVLISGEAGIGKPSRGVEGGAGRLVRAGGSAVPSSTNHTALKGGGNRGRALPAAALERHAPVARRHGET